MKTYSTKAAARKGVKRQGLDVNTLNFVQDSDSRWHWNFQKQEKVSHEGLKIEKDRQEQNGITRPSKGGKCAAIWDACDNWGGTPTPSEIKNWAEDNGFNKNNAVIEMYQWRRFNGIIGRVK